MNDNKLFNLYENILDYCGIKVNEDGTTRIVLGERSYPTEIDGKQLKMPYHENLKSFNPDKEVIFHPFQEHINRGESDVVRKLRKTINVRLNISIISLMDELLCLIASPAEHSKLNPQQRELLRSVGVVTDPMRGYFAEWCSKAFAESPDALFVNIYPKRHGKIRDEKHARVGVVSFPFYQAAKKYSGKIKAAEWEILYQLFEFIFPDSRPNGDNESEAYNGFSDSTDAPWLDCILKTSYNIAGRLNELYSLYREFLDDSNIISFNDKWVEAIDNLGAYRKEIAMIPSQSGNEGRIAQEPAPALPAPTPVQEPKSSPAIPFNSNAIEQAINSNRQINQPQPQMAVVNPAMTNVAPMMQPAQPQQTYTSDGKLSFDSILQQNPMAAYSPGMPSPIVAAAANAQQMAMHAQMMNSPSMMAAAMANQGMMQPGMMGMQPMQPMMQQGMHPGMMMQPGMMGMQPMQGMNPMQGYVNNPNATYNYGIPINSV